jgi:AraC-like DNA-binding protein
VVDSVAVMQIGGAVGGLLHLSTSEMPARSGLPLWLSLWGTLSGRGAVPLRSDAFDSPTFDGQIEYAEIGLLRLCRLKATPHRVARYRVAPAHAAARGFKIVVQIRGASTVSQSGRTAMLAPGEWTVYDTGKPYCVSNPEATEQHVVILPRDSFASARFQMDSITARRYSARMGVGRLACSMVGLALEEVSRQQLQSTDELSDTVLRLFQHAILECNGHETHASRTALLRDRIKTYIENHLRDPGLSINHLARELNYTKRNLHRVFESEGQTISAFIWRTRLELSRRALVNPSLEHRSITDVAYGCGFSSSAHFSRSFKEAFGMSPRDYRHQRLQVEESTGTPVITTRTTA